MYFRSDDDIRACDDVRTELMPFIQSQYASAVRITALLQSAKDHILPDADIALFYDNVFNVLTAKGWGLDVWGNIVGVTRNIPSHADPTVTLTLDDDNYRKLILHKAAANIMDSSLYSMNYLLKQLYPNYTYDVNPMSITYVFINHRLDNLERSIFDAVGDDNRGAGVEWNLYEYIQDDIFGYRNSELQPFDQGVFFQPSGGA